MTKLFIFTLLLLCSGAGAQTFPVQNLQVNGTSNFAGTATFQTGLALTNLANQSANTLLGNPSGAAGNVSAIAVPTCTGVAALQWISGTGFACGQGGLPVFDVKGAYAGNVANAAAAAAAAGGGILYFAANTTFTVSSAITIGMNVNVFCDGGAVIQTTSATADIFDQTGNHTFNFGCAYGTTVPRTAGDYVKLIGFDVHLSNFQMFNGFVGVEIDGSTSRITTGSFTSSVNSSVLCTLAGDSHVSHVTSNNEFTVFGYISGTTLTVTTAAPFNSLTTGQVLQGSGIAQGTQITALGSGTGGTGTYTVSISQTIGSAGSPVSIASSGNGIGINVTGDGGQYGCAMTLDNSGIIGGAYSITVNPSGSGNTGFIFATGNYLDNAAQGAVNISGSSNGGIGYVKLVNNEIGPNGPSANGVLVNSPAGVFLGPISVIGNYITSYPTSSGAGVNFINSTAPLSAIIANNEVGAQGALFAAAISINYSGNSNILLTGNWLKGTNQPVFISNTSDASCIISNNKFTGSINTTAPCHQNNNY